VAAMLAIGCDAEAIFKLTPGCVDEKKSRIQRGVWIFSEKKTAHNPNLHTFHTS